MAPLSVPLRCALTQFDSVCSETPRLRAAKVGLWPDSTNRTASCLNSSVYCFRAAFVIFASLSHWNSLLRDTFCGGKITPGFAGRTHLGTDR